MYEKIKNIKNNIVIEIKQSMFINWIKNRKNMLLMTTLIALFLTLLTYPGIFYRDSYERVYISVNMKEHFYNIFNTKGYEGIMSAWITVLPSFFILLSIELIGSVSLYTFVQTFLLFFITFALGDMISGGRNKWWNRCFVFLQPVLWAYGVYFEAGVGCAIAIMSIVMILWKYEKVRSKLDKIISRALLVFFSCICFGYRANAFTVIPFIIIFVLIKEKEKIKRKVLLMSVLIGMLIAMLIPRILKIDTMSSFVAAFVWESITVIQNVEDKEKYSTYYDDLFGKGVTEEALENNKLSSISGIWWGHPFDSDKVSQPDKTMKILGKYFDIMVDEPETYMEVKWDFITRTLGIKQPIAMSEYFYNRDNRMGKGLYSFNDSEARKDFVNDFLIYMDTVVLFRMPWLMYLIAAFLIVFWRMKFYDKKKGLSLYEVLYGMAVFYYGAFLVNTQSFEFRYFFPAWLLLYLIIISLSGEVLKGIFSKNRSIKEKVIVGE